MDSKAVYIQNIRSYILQSCQFNEITRSRCVKAVGDVAAGEEGGVKWTSLTFSGLAGVEWKKPHGSVCETGEVVSLPVRLDKQR